ncbi:MAG: response regulator transcription factor [Gemmatimonadetes bacterium]|nr:response regulator transcription factor [Gemmatimonadota bacterium]MYI65724.1 response regulator transcription factor [Gemmatimonadota bacterium]
MTGGRKSVVLAGPSPLLLIGIKQVLEATDRYKVVNQAHASELAPALVRRLCPDYAVLDGTARTHTSSRGGIVDTVHGILAESWGGMQIDMAPMKLLSG